MSDNKVSEKFATEKKSKGELRIVHRDKDNNKQSETRHRRIEGEGVYKIRKNRGDSKWENSK